MKYIKYFRRKNSIQAGECHSVTDIEKLDARGALNQYEFLITFKDFSIHILCSGSNKEIISELKSQWRMWSVERGKAYRSRLNGSIQGGEQAS